jgi:Protein of unknown function (DUF3485)
MKGKILTVAANPVVRGGLAILLAVLAVLSFSFIPMPTSSGGAGVVMDLPSTVDSFRGRDQETSEGERTVLPKDTEIIKKAYTNPSGEIVNAQIVLSGAEKRSIHRPELCLPAQGWTINGREYMPVKLADGRSLSVMCDTITRQVEVAPGVSRPLTSLFCYWFVGDGVSTASHVRRVLLTSWDRIVHHKNHRWAYIAVSAPVLEGFMPGGKNPNDTRAMISQFISRIAPGIMNMKVKKDQNPKN